jgi:hypothetical protein
LLVVVIVAALGVVNGLVQSPTQPRFGLSSLLRSSLRMSDKVMGRTFASYVVYKGKGAASIKSIPPVLIPVPNTNSRTVKSTGGLLFEIAPCVGTREYDWQKKATFLLDPTECGEIVSMDTKVGCDFFHDPFMSDPAKSGLITKRMAWKPSQDGRGMFLTLQVTEKGAKQDGGAGAALSIPITWAELEVMRSILRYSIPYYLGFHEVWGNAGLGAQAEAPPSPDGPSSWNNFSEDMR